MMDYDNLMMADSSSLTNQYIPPSANQYMKNTLKLDNNKLTGSIPSQMGLLIFLEYGLSLHSNRLTSSIPTEFGMIGNQNGLQYDVTINDNELTGPVPSELGMLSKLTGYFALMNNKLCGSLPPEVEETEGGQNLTENWDFSGNNIGTLCKSVSQFMTTAILPATTESKYSSQTQQATPRTTVVALTTTTWPVSLRGA